MADTARIGALLAAPVRALGDVESRGGGVRVAGWLVLVGALCFRLEDLARALLGISHLSLGIVLRQLLAAFSHEVGDAVVVVIPAALLITVLAGRGKRDPSRDIELGAACYVPYFAVRSIPRALELEAFLGPLPLAAVNAFNLAACLWAAALALVALRLVRLRPRGAAAAPASPAPGLSSGLRDRAAATLLAAVIGAALFVNAGWVVRHAQAIRPLGRGEPAPGFTLPRLDGQAGTVSLADLKGKTVLLDFWATWCAPCVQMLPTLHRLYQRWQPRGVELVGINSDGPMSSLDEVRAFLSAHPSPYPMVIDDGQVGGAYRVVALPHMVVVGRDGKVRKVFWGVTSTAELDQALSNAGD